MWMLQHNCKKRKMICGPLVNRQIKANGYVTNKEFHNGLTIFLKTHSIYYDHSIWQDSKDNCYENQGEMINKLQFQKNFGPNCEFLLSQMWLSLLDLLLQACLTLFSTQQHFIESSCEVKWGGKILKSHWPF